MITRLELEKISKQTKLPLHMQEKDYLQNIVLFSLSKINLAQGLVFKGGTCLELIYGLDRFSEDLDFVDGLSQTDIDDLFKQIILNLEKFGLQALIKYQRFPKQGTEVRLQFEGPLYKGSQASLSGLKIDLSGRSDVCLPIDIKTVFPKYLDLPRYQIKVMSVKEILSEKIRAFLMRGQSRDLYDIWFLLNKGVKMDLALVKKKLKSYPKFKFSKKEFFRLSWELKEAWQRDLSLTVPDLPAIKDVIRDVADNFVKRQYA